MARLKVDENLPASVARILTALGHDVTTVLDQGLGGEPDDVVAKACRTEQRAILTLDRGFGDLRRPGTAGVIVLRARSQEIGDLLALVQRLGSALAGNEVRGSLWIVEPHRIRVRRQS